MTSAGTELHSREQTAVSRRRLSFFAQLHKPTQVPATLGHAVWIRQEGPYCCGSHVSSMIFRICDFF